MVHLCATLEAPFFQLSTTKISAFMTLCGRIRLDHFPNENNDPKGFDNALKPL